MSKHPRPLLGALALALLLAARAVPDRTVLETAGGALETGVRPVRAMAAPLCSLLQR